MVPHPADHVAGVGAHDLLAVVPRSEVEVLRLRDLVPGDDPGPLRAEGVEPLADVAGVLLAPAPGVPLADVPADGVAEDVVQRLLFGDLAGGLADDHAQLALEVHVVGHLGDDHGAARTDDGRHRLQEVLRHVVVLVRQFLVAAAHARLHLLPVVHVVGRRGPQRGGVVHGRPQGHLLQGRRVAGPDAFVDAGLGVRVPGQRLDDLDHGVAFLEYAGRHHGRSDGIDPFVHHRARLPVVVGTELHVDSRACAWLAPFSATAEQCRNFSECIIDRLWVDDKDAAFRDRRPPVGR